MRRFSQNGDRMKIIRKFKSGKTKIQHDDVVIFVKRYSYSHQHGMVVRSNQRILSESEVVEAYELATGKEAKSYYREFENWNVVEG